MIVGVLPHANDELHDIVMVSDWDGYEVLYNILQLVHPKLNKTNVEREITCQGILDTFTYHVKNIWSMIENKYICGRVYIRYEGLELVLGTLHPKYESALRHKTEMAFENNHDQLNTIPFELHISNLGKVLGGWAQKLRLNEMRSPRVSKVSFTDIPASSSSRVASLSGAPPCNLCQMTGHTKDTCQWFFNHLITAHFEKENPTLAAKILRENKLFIRMKRHNNRDPHCDWFKTNTTITHLAEDNIALDPAPPSAAHDGIEPSMDDCDEIIHDMSSVVFRLAADVDPVEFEGADEDFFGLTCPI
jgi:hypothetical protein